MSDPKAASNRMAWPKCPPPLQFFILLGAGALLQWRWPGTLGLDALPLRLGVGLSLVALGLALAVWGIRSLRSSGSTVEFNKPVEGLACRGPYTFTRNPVYVALVLVALGFAAALDNPWMAGGAPLLVLGISTLVIPLEERFLAERFGDEYKQYCARVRRWL